METIYALATPPGKSGVAVVRISGIRAHPLAQRLMEKALPTRMGVRTLLSPTDNTIIDDALILTFTGPKSFTGEDVVEFHTHGSRAVLDLLLASLSQLPDCRLATAGEFSKRAFLHGKMDLTRAEGLADIIDAETALQLKQAYRQMQGSLLTLYQGWRHKMIDLLAHVEAFIDFPDEDLPPTVIKEAVTDIMYLTQAIDTHLTDDHKGQRLREGYYIAIIGAPNVGKSSLLNWLAKRDVAIVSDIAGTTRDIVEVHLDLEGYPIILADTAGLRESADLVESEGIKRAIDRAMHADMTLALFDAGTLPELDSTTLTHQATHNITLINKVDKRQDVLSHEIGVQDPLFISVATGQGLDQLLARIKAHIDQHLMPGSDPLITRHRYREALIEVVSLLMPLRDANIWQEKPIELLAEDIRIAAQAIGRITGEIDVEEMLDQLFSQFCIGK